MFLHVIPQRREKSASPSSGSHPYQEGGIFRFPVLASSTARARRLAQVPLDLVPFRIGRGPAHDRGSGRIVVSPDESEAGGADPPQVRALLDVHVTGVDDEPRLAGRVDDGAPVPGGLSSRARRPAGEAETGADTTRDRTIQDGPNRSRSRADTWPSR